MVVSGPSSAAAPLNWFYNRTPHIYCQMKEEIASIIKKVVGDGIPFDVSVPPPGQESFGHYSTNVALRASKLKKRPPFQLAEEWAREMKKAAPEGFLEKVESAEPGHINFWLTKETIKTKLSEIFKKKEKYRESNVGKGKTVIVEYSQPNIGKMLHVGHLRTTIIGDALANIFEYLGYKVIRWNYLGDWGTQFGKLIAAYKLWGDKKTVEANPLDELQKLYVRFHDEAKKDLALEVRGQAEFKKLEDGDKENRKLWEWFRKESLIELEKIYKTLGVRFDTYIGESFFEKDMRPLVEELREHGITKKSEGATIISLVAFGLPPALIEKRDGASLYLARDIANLQYRLAEYKPAKILYVVANDQSLHFEQLFAIAKILRLDPAELKHVKYGLVLGESGTKLATREGRVILLKDVLEKAIKLAREVVEEKNKGLSAKEKDEIASAVGVGALKYNDLKENRNSDIAFDWKTMLDFTGDSAPYLQYTYARMRSILRKSKDNTQKPKVDFGKLEREETELALARKIIEFPEQVAHASEALTTSTLANYLYKLAVLSNRLYETTPVLKEENIGRRAALLALIATAAETLKKGLGLLGIETLEEI